MRDQSSTMSNVYVLNVDNWASVQSGHRGADNVEAGGAFF